MGIRYRVTLTEDERTFLEKFCKTGTKSARSVLLVRALLLIDAGDHGPHLSEELVSQATGLSCRPIERLKKRFVEEGLETALERKQRDTPPRPVKFDGAFEARLIALACSDPPEGRARWTVRLLAEKAVELAITDSVSPMTVCNILKKTNFNLTFLPEFTEKGLRYPSLFQAAKETVKHHTPCSRSDPGECASSKWPDYQPVDRACLLHGHPFNEHRQPEKIGSEKGQDICVSVRRLSGSCGHFRGLRGRWFG